MPPDGTAPNDEQYLDDAKALIMQLLQGSITPETVFVKDVLQALARIKDQDFPAFVTIKATLKQAKIPLRDLDRAMKSYVPTLRLVREEGWQPKVAGDFLPDAPLPDLLIPSPYSLDDQGTYRMEEDVNGIPHPLSIAYAPVLITGRLQSIDDHSQWLRLAWKRMDRWLQVDVDRGLAMNAQKLLDLASQGFPVASDNAGHMAHYLHELEAVNYQVLPTAHMATRLGWQGEQGAYGFLCGRTLSRADEVLTIDDLSSVPTTQWQEKWIAFHGHAVGDEQIVDGFHTRGTYEGWCEAVKTIIGFPRVRVGLYASFAVPLLEILHVPNFTVDWSARTSVGKTTTLRVVASPWGCPDERRAGESILFSWNSTKVWAERAASVLNGLPFILDESKLATKGMVPQVLYMVANGIGRGRGNPKGLAPAKRWRTILFSTGESPATSCSKDGGSRMRVLTIRGYPFGSQNKEILKVIGELTANLYLNYGHAGPRFTQWLLKHRDQWPAWEKSYARHRESCIGLVNDEAAYRLADYAAVIRLTAELVHKALRLPWDQPPAITDHLWTAIVEEASGAPGHVRALRDVMSWAYGHQETFDGRGARERDGYVRPPSQGWSGRWDLGKWTEIGFYPHVLKAVLIDAGYDPEAILTLWKEEGWILRSRDGKHLGKRTRIRGEQAWLITIDRTTIEVVDGESEVGTVGP